MNQQIQFKPLFGHESVQEALLSLRTKNRLPQAFCFSGPQGIGKELLAKLFIALDMCKSPGLGLSPCGNCEACRKLAQGNHPDFFYLEPEKDSIKIDAIRALLHESHFRPLLHERRWVLVSRAEELTEQAQNALLRTLEEPPKDTHFILITAAREQLLQTIRSRCQTVRFGALSSKLVKEILQSLQVDAKLLGSLLSMAQGSPGRALKIFEGELAEVRKTTLTALCEILSEPQVAKRQWQSLVLAQNLSGHKLERSIIVEIMQSFFRDLSLVHLGTSSESLENSDFLQELQDLSHLSMTSILAGERAISQIAKDFQVNTHAESTYLQAFYKMSSVHESR